MDVPLSKRRILILGGGFAGAYTAMYLEKRLRRRSDVEVALVAKENFILFTPMLHEVAGGDLEVTDIVQPLRKMVRHARVAIADIEAIDIVQKKVRVKHKDLPDAYEVTFDQLVLAVGSVTNFYHTPGLQEHAFTMKSLGDAILVRNRMIDALGLADNQVNDMERKKTLTVVVAGGGFAGIETAGAVNDLLREAAQHAVRQAKVLADNIAASLDGGALRPFRFKILGMLATIGRRKAVAEVLGLRFSGIIAWWMWRSIYLSKLPGLQKKVRVAIDWALDLVFSKDLVQLPTLRSPTISETEEPAIGPEHEPRVPAD